MRFLKRLICKYFGHEEPYVQRISSQTCPRCDETVRFGARVKYLKESTVQPKSQECSWCGQRTALRPRYAANARGQSYECADRQKCDDRVKVRTLLGRAR